jgi:hypothetical protein
MERSPEVLRVLWISFLVSQGVYAVLGLSGIIVQGEPVLPGTLTVIFAGVAVVAAAAAQFFWMRGGGHGTLALVAWGFDEIIALLGLVLALLGGPVTHWLPFLGAGVLMTVLHMPRGDD